MSEGSVIGAAFDRVVARSVAATGAPELPAEVARDPRSVAVSFTEDSPDDLARRMFVGLVEAEDVDELVRRIAGRCRLGVQVLGREVTQADLFFQLSQVAMQYMALGVEYANELARRRSGVAAGRESSGGDNIGPAPACEADVHFPDAWPGRPAHGGYPEVDPGS